jgi:hypothetical protein
MFLFNRKFLICFYLCFCVEIKRGMGFVKRKKMGFVKREKGQVWIETVVYTLIGVVIIALVLAFAKPKLDEYQSKQVYTAMITSFNELDTQIEQVYRYGSGNKREITLYVSHGSMTIYGNNECEYSAPGDADCLIIEIEGMDYQPGEEGYNVIVPGTNMKVRTKFNGKNFDVSLIRIFNPEVINLNYNGEDKTYSLSPSPSPYKILIENKGKPSGSGPTTIDLTIGS